MCQDGSVVTSFSNHSIWKRVAVLTSDHWKPQETGWQTWSKTCGAAELPMPHWQEDRLKNIDEHNKRVPSIQVIMFLFALSGCPKATRFLCIAIWSCCFFCRVLYREHWVKLQLVWEVPHFTNWLAMEKWKTKRYDTTQPRLHVIWIMALLIMFFLTCLNLSSRLKIGKLFVHALFLFVVFSCLLPFCRYGPIYRFFHFTILPQPKEPRPWTHERPFSRITPSPGLWST